MIIPETVYIRLDGDDGIEFTDSQDPDGFEFTNTICTYIKQRIEQACREQRERCANAMVEAARKMPINYKHELTEDDCLIKAILSATNTSEGES